MGCVGLKQQELTMCLKGPVHANWQLGGWWVAALNPKT